jgi:hypothetical protein
MAAEAAVRAAVEVATAEGLEVSDPVVLRDLGNVLVHLRPAPVVARVATGTARVRPGEQWLGRELAVAWHLADAGAPAVRPATEVAPGPHLAEGLYLTFWSLEQVLDGPVSPDAAGAALRACHDALHDFAGHLPLLGPLTEAEAIVARLAAEERIALDDASLLIEAHDRLRMLIGALRSPVRPLHADSHLGNAFRTPGGVIWGDWEDACLGPVEWDLACLVADSRVFATGEDRAQAALDGFGGAYDGDVLELLVEARALQLAAWTSLLAGENPRRRARAEARLDWFRARR